MRYLQIEDALTALLSGRSIEQLLDNREEEGLRIIRFVRLDKERSGKFSVTCMEVIDEGSSDFLDVYEFSALDPDLPYGKVTSFESALQAVDFSLSDLKADPRRFVNAGMIQDEYKDVYILGRGGR